MVSLTSVCITYCLFTSVLSARKILNDQQSIGFPESEEDAALSNKDERQPVFMPATCPIGELYYPGDQKDDWICDCRPGYLYYPKTDSCYSAYRQGPCEYGYYLVLGQDSAIPFCEQNPCTYEGYVMYNGKCQRLDTSTPCIGVWPDYEVLTINSTTLTISCQSILTFTSRITEFQDIRCYNGGKRSINGKCNPNSVTTT